MRKQDAPQNRATKAAMEYVKPLLSKGVSGTMLWANDDGSYTIVITVVKEALSELLRILPDNFDGIKTRVVATPLPMLHVTDESMVPKKDSDSAHQHHTAHAAPKRRRKSTYEPH